MTITLREISMQNFFECINLRVADEQQDFVATNAFSLAEAKADGVSHPLAIYADNEMVGFVMYDVNARERRGYISRLMVDARFQGRGYGRAALSAVVNRLRREPGLRDIQTAHHPDNVAAATLYASLGFRETGEFAHGEVVVRIPLGK